MWKQLKTSSNPNIRPCRLTNYGKPNIHKTTYINELETGTCKPLSFFLFAQCDAYVEAQVN